MSRGIAKQPLFTFLNKDNLFQQSLLGNRMYLEISLAAGKRRQIDVATISDIKAAVLMVMSLNKIIGPCEIKRFQMPPDIRFKAHKIVTILFFAIMAVDPVYNAVACKLIDPAQYP